MSDQKDVSLLCPTRWRQNELERMIDSALSTATCDVEILLYIDDDDPTRYRDWSPAIEIVGPSDGVGRAWNRLARKARGERLMMANDDLVFKTIGWDYELLSREPTDKIYVAWFNDDSRKPERCAFPIVSRRWYEALGYFVPEVFHFLWHDAWIWDIGKRLRREMPILDVHVEHRHFAFKKAPYDDTYKRHRVGPDNARKRKEDEATFHATAKQRQLDADKLHALMDGVDERRIAELTYEAVWKIERYREASPGLRAAPRAMKRLGMKAGETLIDYGCGTGLAALWFMRKGLSVVGVDITATALNQEVASLINKLGQRLGFVEACLWGDDRLALVQEADWAFCADVMEHIPENRIDMVLDNIAARTRIGGFFNTSNGDDCFGPMIARELHPTKRQPEWWKRKLAERFDVIHDEPGDRPTTWSFYVRTR